MRFIVGFLVTIGLLIFAFVLILRGGGDDAAVVQTKKMMDYANTSVTVGLTIVGPVTADQNHKEIRVTVGAKETVVEVYKGYEEVLLTTTSYPNNSAAYADFLRALDLAGYDLGSKDKVLADERGYCATGKRYVYTISDGQKDIQRFWNSSCGSGTFQGKGETVRKLFTAQVPNYSADTAAFTKK